MGGPMNVDETAKYAWLAPERALLSQLIERDARVLGICLGAQLLARAAGARVYPQRPKEIGLFPVSLTAEGASDRLFSLFADPQQVFQWHGDTFDLPDGAVLLARSERFAHQAFRLGRRVYALQFHLECTLEIVRNLQRACEGELAELPPGDAFAQYAPRLAEALAAQNQLARELILRWIAM
jgi:GMP synthase-like glutamine amidotransferase